MIKLLLIFILSLNILFASKEEKIYTVAFLKEWKPYYITDEKNNLDGYVFELFEAISKKTDLKFKYKIVNTWIDINELSKKGEIDIVPNIGITKDREILYNFSQPTDTFKIKLFKRKDSIHIEKKDDLHEKHIGVMKTNICNKIITKEFETKKIVFTNFSRFINALSSGEIDALCYPESLLNTKLNDLALTNKINSFGESLKEVKRGVGITKENFDLLPIINEAISEIKINGDFDKIYAKWFGKKENSTISKDTFNIILIVIALIFFLLLFVVIWNNKLQKEYKKQEELKNKLKSAQDIAKVGHYTFFYKDDTFTCSEQIDKIFGIEKNSKKDTNLWLELLHPDDKKRVADYWKDVISKQMNFELEYRIINKKTKETIWVLGLGKVIRDNNFAPIQMFGTIQNINDIKKTEEKLNQAMMVFENTHDGIMITDKNTNIINVNRSFEITTGYTLREVINKKPNVLKSGQNDEDLYKNMWASLKSKGVWSGEIINKNKKNKIYYELLTINTLYNDNNEITGYIGIFTDITKNKTDEKMIMSQSKIAAVGEMLGNISHQWRQPLSVITTHATGIKLNIELDINFDKELVIKSMDEINNQAQYLSKTIDDFRNFFNDKVEDTSSFSSKNAFDKLENLTKDILKNNYIKYSFQIIDIKLPRNENLFIQALINIYNNAKDALIENEKNSDNRFLFIETKSIDNFFEISIKDTGGGIPSNIQDKIFDPYFTTKHQSVGTGIGLYMTHQIVTKQLKGNIFVENIEIEKNGQILKGTEFKIVLPMN